jgi:uncharacterized protein (DUF2267 family)
MPHLDVFQTTLQKSEEWIADIQRALDCEPRRAYQALRAVLHTLRDRLPVLEATHFGAQLPMLIRGLYYEGWRSQDNPVKANRAEFLETIAAHFSGDFAVDSATVMQGVLCVMANHMDPSEIVKIERLLPKDFADLWPVVAVKG